MILLMGASQWDNPGKAEFVYVESNAVSDAALYRDGKKFREWERNFDCSCDSPLEIVEDLGFDVEYRLTDEYPWTFPELLKDIQLRQDKCPSCNEYVCRTCT